MRLRWTASAFDDLQRLHDFLAVASPAAAARTVRLLVAAPVRLTEHPRLGERLEEFGSREVRRLLAGAYEIRYEVRPGEVVVLSLWHMREER